LKSYNLLEDIYYSKEYSSLYIHEGESVFEFHYQENKELFYNMAIKKPINKIGSVDVNDGYYDLETAYGYGGYYSTSDNPAFLSRAIDAYKKKCLNENIIAEFIRFHPYNKFPFKYSNLLDFVVADRDVVVIDLSISKSERWSKYNEATRRKIRKGSSALLFEESIDINRFIDLYQSTMRKNKAEEFYYFPYHYFENLLSLKNVKLFAVKSDDHIVHMSIFFFCKNIVHYHLGANDNNYLHLNANSYVFDSVCDYAKDNYITPMYFNLGGGRSNANEDSLLAFKSGFSDIRKKYFIAGNVYDPSVYFKYTKIYDQLYPEYTSNKYFLKYRMSAYE